LLVGKALAFKLHFSLITCEVACQLQALPPLAGKHLPVRGRLSSSFTLIPTRKLHQNINPKSSENNLTAGRALLIFVLDD
jgi:hypothetical protein